MGASRRVSCIVCGRVFPEGQGVRVSIANETLAFHSKACALKFFKSLILYLDQKDLENAVKMVLKEYAKSLEELSERRKKDLEKIQT